MRRGSRKKPPPVLSPLATAVYDTAKDFLRHQPTTPSMLSDLCEGMFESLDSFYEQNPPPQPLACGPGCDFCCYNQVRATLPEIITLVMFLKKTRTALELKMLTRDIQSHTMRIRGLADLDIPRDLPCIFLRNGTCSVYQARPFACRGWHALNREDCRLAFENEDPLAPIEHYPQRRQAAIDFSLGMSRALNLNRLPNGDILLPLGIGAVLPFAMDRLEKGWFPLFQTHQHGTFPRIA